MKPPFSTFDEAFEYLCGFTNYEQKVDYQYRPETLDLGRMRALAEFIGNPHHSLIAAHIAGTKGKGSTATILTAILRKSGKKVGLYTSPHLEQIEERIETNDGRISPEEMRDFLNLIYPHVEACKKAGGNMVPTFFEVFTAMAFHHFAVKKVDIAVIEVGLGGRLDATNIIIPEVSAISTIDFDHMEKLGYTLAAIAREKSGIIKPGVPVVTSVDKEEPLSVIREVAKQRGCVLHRVGEYLDREDDVMIHTPTTDDEELSVAVLGAAPATIEGRLGFRFTLRSRMRCYDNLFMPYPGFHQKLNCALAVGIAEELEKKRLISFDSEVVRLALWNVVLPGRIEIFSRRPTIILDGAHNVASMIELRGALETFKEKLGPGRRIAVFGASSDKDIKGMLRQIEPVLDEFIFVRARTPRAVPPERLVDTLSEFSRKPARTAGTIADGITMAKDTATVEDVIVVTGSFYVAGETKRILRC